MKIIIITLSAILLIGCTNGELTLTPEETKKSLERKKLKGEARKIVFVECMELAAKMPRQADDDVSDIVSECSSQAYYMTNYLR